MAYNEFRRACGLLPYSRIQFAATVAHHNATIVKKSPEDREAWRKMEEAAARFDIDNDTPEA